MNRADKTRRQEDATTWPIAIIGTGPVGLLAALALEPLHEKIILIGSQAQTEDNRTSALMMPAINLLEQVGLWDGLRRQAAALSTLRIIDATNRLIRAPTVTFRAAEIDEVAFGYNIPNKALNMALRNQVKATPNIIWYPHAASHYQYQGDFVTIDLADGSQHQAAMIVAADGRNSPARTAAGIKVRQWHYPQTALVLNFTHQQPHQNTSTEFHTAYGPFTQVPLPGNRSSLVWVLTPEQANHLLGLGRDALAQAIEENMGSMLGKISMDETNQDFPPQAWPMGGAVLSHFAANRTLLVGEAAHVFPPIGAQGLNLGFRDIADLVHVLRHHNAEAEISPIIDAYNRLRRPDIWARTGFIHTLNRTLLSNFLPAQLLRSAGLEALRQFSPLRALMMREGLSPGRGFRNLLPYLPFSKTVSEPNF